MLAGLVASGWALREPLRRGLPQRVSIEQTLLLRLQRWAQRHAADPQPSGMLFGDSLLICDDGANLATLVSTRLTERGEPLELFPLVHPAFRPLTAYYLLDLVLAARPTIVIVSMNLRLFGDAPAEPSFRFAALSRHLSTRRALRIRDALAADELGVASPALYRLEERLGLLYVADGVREVGRSTLVRVGAWVNHLLGYMKPEALLRVIHGEQARHDAGARRRVRTSYAIELDGPQTHVLRLFLAELRAAGIGVLVYVSPVDVQRIESFGLTSELALGENIEALRRAVDAQPDEWLDLHATEGSEAFRDAWDHLRRPACDRVADAVADAVAMR